MPIPPSWASAIARSLSVTVPIGEDTIGMLMRMFRVSWVRTSTSRGTTSLYAGSRRTSSKVMPWYAIRSCMGNAPSEGSFLGIIRSRREKRGEERGTSNEDRSRLAPLLVPAPLVPLLKRLAEQLAFFLYELH